MAMLNNQRVIPLKKTQIPMFFSCFSMLFGGLSGVGSAQPRDHALRVRAPVAPGFSTGNQGKYGDLQWPINVDMSENGVYPQLYHLVGIMIINHWV